MGDGGPQGAGPMQVEIKKEGRRGDRSIYWGLQKGIDARCRDTCGFPAGKVGKKRRKPKGIEFYIHSFVLRNSILMRSNKMQQHAGIYLLQNHCTCFRCPSHPSSGERKTVTAASGTGHSI